MATAKKTTKVFDLAKATLKMKDEDKAIVALQEKVEDNEMLFSNEIHNAKKEVRRTEKYAEGLTANPSATPSQILDAQEAVKVAAYTLESFEAIAAERF